MRATVYRRRRVRRLTPFGEAVVTIACVVLFGLAVMALHLL